MTYVDETDFYLFLQGYREAMLANTLEYGGDGVAEDELGPSLDAHVSDPEIDPETWAQAESDCRGFLESIVEGGILPLSDDGSIVWPYVGYRAVEWSGAELAGNDFALTRNRHDDGFWDRGLGEVGEALSDMAQAYSVVTWVIEDDRVVSL